MSTASILPTATARITAAWLQVNNQSVPDPLPPETELAPLPIGGIIAIIMQLLTTVLGGCGGGTVAKQALNTQPLLSRLRLRQGLSQIGEQNHPRKFQLISASMLVGQQSTAPEMDQYLAETAPMGG